MDSEILRIPITTCLDKDPINEKAGQNQKIIDLLATANRRRQTIIRGPSRILLRITSSNFSGLPICGKSIKTLGRLCIHDERRFTKLESRDPLSHWISKCARACMRHCGQTRARWPCSLFTSFNNNKVTRWISRNLNVQLYLCRNAAGFPIQNLS